MHYIEESVDDRQKSWCIHCAKPLSQVVTSKDHVPSKSLLQKPHPPQLPVITICKECNSSFSKDEEYLVALLSFVLAGSSDPGAQSNASAARSLARSPKLRGRIAQSLTYQSIGGQTRSIWKPETERVQRVVLKNARVHAYYEFGEPMLELPTSVWFSPLEYLTPSERQEFEAIKSVGEAAGWPEVGSRMMTRAVTGHDMSGPWIVVQRGTYRYAVLAADGLMVRSVLSEYLATEVVWRE